MCVLSVSYNKHMYINVKHPCIIRPLVMYLCRFWMRTLRFSEPCRCRLCKCVAITITNNKERSQTLNLETRPNKSARRKLWCSGWFEHKWRRVPDLIDLAQDGRKLARSRSERKWAHLLDVRIDRQKIAGIIRRCILIGRFRAQFKH